MGLIFFAFFEKFVVPILTSGGYVGLSIATLLSQHHKVTAVDHQLFIRLHLFECFHKIADSFFRHQSSKEQNVRIFAQPELIRDQFSFPDFRPIDAIRNKSCFPSVCLSEIILNPFAQYDDLICIFHGVLFTLSDKLGADSCFPFFTLPIQAARCQVLDNFFHK